MYKKLSTKNFAIIFILLLVVVLAMTFFNDESKQNTFKSILVSVDSSMVSKITIYPKDKSKNAVILVKDSKGWSIIDNGKTYSADINAIMGMISALKELKPARVAAMNKDKWGEFEVTDSAAVRVTTSDVNNNILCDLYIGKFSYQQPKNQYQRQGTMSTYVRLKGEEEVYCIEGFLSMTFNADINSLRNKTLISTSSENFKKLQFIYPADSSFTLEKLNNKWTVNGLVADSVKVANYLNSISNLNSNTIVENNTGLITPLYSLKIEGDNMIGLELKAFPADSINGFILNSNFNPDTYFGGNQNGFFNKAFISSKSLLNN